MKWKIAKQILTINIQDDGKTSNLSKIRRHQIQGEIPILTHERIWPDYRMSGPGYATLKLKFFKRKMFHGAYPILST